MKEILEIENLMGKENLPIKMEIAMKANGETINNTDMAFSKIMDK